jgi:hypothetical protein
LSKHDDFIAGHDIGVSYDGKTLVSRFGEHFLLVGSVVIDHNFSLVNAD